MLNKIWPIFIIVSIFYSFLTGNVDNLNNTIFKNTENTIQITLNLLGTICFWNGIMKIAINTSLTKKLQNLISPIMKLLFPKIKKETKLYKEITMNIISNILGLGNAATPLGIKAIQSMQEENENKEKLSDDMCTLIVLNTASIQIIPTTVIAIRASLKSNNPTSIIFPVWIATICAFFTGLISLKIFMRLERGK